MMMLIANFNLVTQAKLTKECTISYHLIRYLYATTALVSSGSFSDLANAVSDIFEGQ